MKKLLILTCIIFIAIALFSSTAFSWGPSTHAYIGNKLGNKFGYLNLQEMYGAMVPDMFNLTLEENWIYQTHYEFMKVVDSAKWRSQKAFAFGFASHNDDWGADFTAHSDAQYLEPPTGFPPDLQPGYVIIKAFLLNADTEVNAILDGLPIESRLMLCHIAVEGAVDLLVREELDKGIGMKMFLSAWLRSPSVPYLLYKAYHMSIPPGIIITAEKEFRQLIMQYGLMLMQSPVEAQESIASYAADYVYEILGIEVSDENANTILDKAKEICKDDFDDELSTTIEYLEQKLKEK